MEHFRTAVNINILGLKRLINLCHTFVNLEVSKRTFFASNWQVFKKLSASLRFLILLIFNQRRKFLAISVL